MALRGRCTIKSPCNGTIDELKINVGELVEPHKVLLGLIDPVHVQVAVELPLDDYEQVNRLIRSTQGGVCHLTCDFAPNVNWRGVVSQVAPKTTTSSRETFEVLVDVDNTDYPDFPLMDGFLVSATIARVDEAPPGLDVRAAHGPHHSIATTQPTEHGNGDRPIP